MRQPSIRWTSYVYESLRLLVLDTLDAICADRSQRGVPEDGLYVYPRDGDCLGFRVGVPYPTGPAVSSPLFLLVGFLTLDAFSGSALAGCSM